MRRRTGTDTRGIPNGGHSSSLLLLTEPSRSAVELDPLWLLLDMTPEGRGEDWRPQLRQ